MKDSRIFPFRLSLVAALALVLRSAAVLWIPTQPVSDFWSYVHLAGNLVRDHSYEWSPGNPTALLAPGYPLLLAGVFAVTGPSLVVTKVIDVVLSVVTVVLGGLAARALVGAAPAIAAAMILCLDPRQILLACLPASEHLGAPALFVFLWLLALSWRRRRSVSLAVVSGIVLAASALARPVGLYAWLLWPICGALAGKPRKAVLVETSLLLVAVYAILLPWGFRNLDVVGRFTISTTTTGINLFMGNNDGSTGTWSNYEEELRAVRPEATAAPQGRLDAIAADEARRWIVANPLRAAMLYLRKFYMYVWLEAPTQVSYWAIYATQVSPPSPPADSVPGAHFLKRHPAAVEAVLDGGFRVLVALGLLGCVRLLWIAWRRPEPFSKPAGAALVGLTLYFPAITSVFIVVDRYRWPMEDLLALLGGFGLIGLWSWTRK